MSREILSFQRGLIPLLRYMSSDFVVQSTLKTQANQLYMTVLQNLPNFADAVEKSMDSIIESCSFNDPGAVGKDLIDPQAFASIAAVLHEFLAFASIAGVLHEFLVRFKNAVATYPRLAPLVMSLQKWFGEWKTGISANPPSFDSGMKTLQPNVRDLLVQTLSEKINKLVSIVEREQGKEQRSDSQKQRATHAVSNEGLLAALESSYEGPGALRELGPRHDNDFKDISDIQWKTGISANPPSFDSALKTLQPNVRDLLVQTLSEKINKLVSIVEREQGKEQRSDSQKQRATYAVSNEGLLAALESSYEGPGALRELGPRHDNDFEDISDIRIAPTHGELMSRVPPFLPVNFFGAPHPAPPESMQRLLDIQFRLLREELTYVEQRSDSQKQRTTHAASNEGLLAALESSYEGPGALHEGGPRHDNDFEDISDIRIAPTHGELMSRIPPFLPVNFFGAPHPAPLGSIQRLLDIQFRLLREELTAPLRKAVQLIHDDMTSPQHKKTKLAELLKNRGGKYRGQADAQDSLMFNVYTGVQFCSLVPDWRGISSSIIIDTPPGRARSNNAAMRASFWEGTSGKRLIQGGLIALIW
ncbi:hypothetical protein AZE42_01786, partial [Rhizopogon vesiculosus]